MTSGRLCGFMTSRPKPRRGPTTIASTRPATPALMWTTVPPAKSMGATVAAASAPVPVVPKIIAAIEPGAPESRPPPQTMCASGA